jgi:hypothetical protein
MTLSELRLKGFGIACAIALVGLLAACSKSGNPTQAVGSAAGPGTPATIQGVSTPSSVSVVTAN